MKLNRIILLLLICLLTVNNAFAFVNCQSKYDSDKRSLPSKHGNCAVCHLNPNGTGPQNEFGRAFLKAGKQITDELVAQFPELFKQQEEDSTAPVIQRVKPKKVKINVQSTLQVKGINFVNESVALVDENEIITTFKSNMLLIVDFILDTIGVHTLKIKNPDSQESNTVRIKAKN